MPTSPTALASAGAGEQLEGVQERGSELDNRIGHERALLHPVAGGQRVLQRDRLIRDALPVDLHAVVRHLLPR